MKCIDVPTRKRHEIIREMTLHDNNLLNISTLCDIAAVSRSGYYGWLAAESKRKEREQQDRKDFDKILTAYSHRGYAKGARSIYMRLLHQDPPTVMNLKKIRRLMAKYGMRACSESETCANNAS